MTDVKRFFGVLLLSLVFSVQARSQEMKGHVYDAKTKAPLDQVLIYNTFTDERFRTDSGGHFALRVEEGHLIEISKLGYKIVRIRIPAGRLPFYSLEMREGVYELPEINIVDRNFQTDSVQKREVYEWAIEHYQLSAVDMLNHPFDALSKRNRQIWAFQKRYAYFEKQKFIDYVFNDRLIEKITGIKDPDQLQAYKQRFRPSYEQINAWNDYEFFEYIQKTGTWFTRSDSR